MTWNFSAVAFDQILNNAAKIRQMSGGQLECPIVFRGPNASARQVGSQHSHAMEHFYAHVPGLKVVAPGVPGRREGAPQVRHPRRQPGARHGVRDALRGEGRRARRRARRRRSARRTIVRPGQGRDPRRVLAHDARGARGRRRRSRRRASRPRWSTSGACARSTRTRWWRASSERTGWSWCTRAGRTAASAPRSPTACSASPSTRSTRPILRVTTLDVPMPYSAKLEHACMPQPERVVATVLRALGRSGQLEGSGGRDGENSRDAEAVADDGRGRPLGVAQEGGRRGRRRRSARRGRDRQGDDGVSRLRQGDACSRSSSRPARR